MAELQAKGRIDLEMPESAADPRCRLDYLFGEARGQMFGVMEYRGPDGSCGVLRAFSGQYNGLWQVAGWAPPLFDIRDWHQVNSPGERQVKSLSQQIASLASHDPERRQLMKKRRQLSRQLMKRLHGLYRLNNFRGQVAGLEEVFHAPGGIPTGSGDCCAPKLLNYAARHQLTPLGISEFYLGRENRSQTKRHGAFYSACAGKCQPILGFLLCGLEQLP